MTEHHNKLTPAEAERLAILAEECGEVIQMVGKILRHGLDNFNPFYERRVTNRELLSQEVGDVYAIVRVMMRTGDLDEVKVFHSDQSKIDRMWPWLNHQPDSIKDEEHAEQTRPVKKRGSVAGGADAIAASFKRP